MKFQTVMFRKEADYEGVISVENEAEELTQGLVYWTAGAEAACPVNKTNENRTYKMCIRDRGADIAAANYQHDPIDLKGRRYTSFKTYSGELPQFKEIRNYTDTADTGDDYLCSIDYGVTFANEAYILDVLYTKEPMEVTEPAAARMLKKDLVMCLILNQTMAAGDLPGT